LYAVGVLLALSGFASVFMTHQNAGLLLGALLMAAVVGISKLGYDEFAMVKRGVVLRVYDAPVLKKGLFVVFADLALIAISLYGAIVLKYDDWAVVLHRDMLLGIAALLPAMTLLIFSLMQIYQRAWSNASILDVMKLTLATITASTATYLTARLAIAEPPTVTFMITYTLVMLVLVNGVRASYRMFYQLNRESNADGELVVIYGAGRGGALALREILTNTAVPMKPIGFIDDNPLMKGRFINGYPVLGNLDDLADVVLNGKARGLVIASEKIPITKLRNAQAVCESRGAWMRVFTIDFRIVTGDTDAA
jgi:UDP-GlcNAc:undecaprenyl-phosphate/decaprenyl-phosphate GlcNAc-1-phosphate transferase